MNKLAGLDDGDSLQVAKGTYFWHQFDFSEYNLFDVFAHPAKLSRYSNSAQGVQYCSIYIQDKINNDLELFSN
jgi:hypothetical protein